MSESHNSVQLREYVDLQVAWLRSMMESQFIAARKEVELAKSGLDVRLEGMNEFRRQLDKERQTFVTMPELNALKIQVEDLRLSRANIEGKASQSLALTTLAISVAALFIGAIGMYFK